MVVDTLLDKLPAWLAGESAVDTTVVLATQCTLARNLGDFPFPHRCSDEDRRAVETRVLNTLDNLNLLASGRYYPMQELCGREQCFLAERRIVTRDMLGAKGAHGVFIAEDQSLSIMLNGADHLCVRVIRAGAQAQEAWAQVNLLDDTLGGALDFAYDERLGFLSAALAHVGTGLKLSALLHLPALSLTNRLGEAARIAGDQHMLLSGMKMTGPDRRLAAAESVVAHSSITAYEDVSAQSLLTDVEGAVVGLLNESAGDLYFVVNQSTLGFSEEEIAFQARQAFLGIAELEKSAREELLREIPRGIEDQAGRARGIAGGARLMSFPEALSLLSGMRFGCSMGVIRDVAVETLNELFLAAQGAHLELARGQDCDALTLSMERADLFRRAFSSA